MKYRVVEQLWDSSRNCMLKSGDIVELDLKKPSDNLIPIEEPEEDEEEAPIRGRGRPPKN